MNKHYDNWLECENTFDIITAEADKDYTWIVTNDTIFYVEGGGMAKDTGTINGHIVEDIKYKDGLYYHKVLGKIKDTKAHMIVDKNERISKAQIHSASHLICGHINKKYNAKTIAFFTNKDISGCEMEFKTFDTETMKQIEEECNKYIIEDLPVKIVYPTKEEAREYVLEEKLNHNELRAVLIGDIDYNMCGCIHVPSLRYLQMIKLLNYEKTTRGYKIYFICGTQLINTYNKQLEVLNKSANNLGIPQLEVHDGIKKLRQEIKELKVSESEWKQKTIDLKVKELIKSKDKYLVHEIDDLDIKSFTTLCSTLVKNYEKGIFFVCKYEERCHIVIARHQNLDFKANELFKEIATKFSLKGGGNIFIAQGGGEYSNEIIKELKILAKSIN